MSFWELVLLYFRVLSEWVTTLISTCVVWILITISVCFLLRLWIMWRGRGQLPELRQSEQGDGDAKPLVIGFFHPYCNAGGGGERVLWTAIRALQNKYRHVRCVVYTGDVDATPDEILARAGQRFGITLPRPGPGHLQLVFLRRRQWVEAAHYPVLTLLGQSLGSLVLAAEALYRFVPDVYVDTMGYAFSLPLFRYLGGCRVGAYVHYPTISTDMLQQVSRGTRTYNNASFISRSPFLSQLKILYYRLFAYAYGMAGKRGEVVMVNSSWTHGHIASLWRAPSVTHVVYPPCDVKGFLDLPLTARRDQSPVTMVSVGQFRPEKDHPLQLKAYHAFLQTRPEKDWGGYRLQLIGGCRDQDDQKRVGDLQELCRQLGIEDHVEFKLNVSYAELKECLARATIGLHTMWNEHFGIGVVELMAAGTVTLAHDSGGPKLDIVRPFNGQPTGFLASDVTSYCNAMRQILELSPKERTELCENARRSVQRFSEQEFDAAFLSVMDAFFPR